MKSALIKEGTVRIVLEQGHQEQRREPRQSVPTEVVLRMIVADKAGLGSGHVVDITPRGCGLHLTKPLTRGQYLTLMVYPNDMTTAVQCTVAQVQWAEKDRAGVAFLWMSREHDYRLRQLCGDRLRSEVEV